MCRKADLQCVKVLLKFKVQTSARNKRALTPLGEAIVGGHLAVVTHLVEVSTRPKPYVLSKCQCVNALAFIRDNGCCWKVVYLEICRLH